MKKKLAFALIAAGTVLGTSTLALAQVGPNFDPYPDYAITNSQAVTTGSASRDFVPFASSAPSRRDPSWGASSGYYGSDVPWSSSTNPETPTR